jgi:Brp/Blh family beta-carotene 15,15'-monooxygenase
LPPPLAPTIRYVAVASITGVVAALAGGGVDLGGATGGAFLGAAVLLTGMPHGAVDHLVAQRLFDLRGPRGAALFYGAYVTAAALYGLVWLASPRVALGGFVLMAAYHFGQADLAYLAPRSRAARAGLYLSRGVFVAVGPLAAHPRAVAPLVEAISGFAPLEAAPVLAEAPLLGLTGLAAQHALALGVRAGAEENSNTRWMRREVFSVALLTVLFGAAPPLVGFSVYFGLWHALGHIFVLLRFFRAAGADAGGDPFPSTAAAFYRRAAAYTVLPLVGLAVFAGLTARPGRMLPPMPEALAALFVLISVLTLPHMLLVEQLYHHERSPHERPP